MNIYKLGDLIKQARMNKNLDQPQFIHRLKMPMSPSYLTRMEKHGEIPSPEMLKDMCEVLELDHEATIRIAIDSKLAHVKEKLWRNYHGNGK
jgi:transcriptional regulator with XRE-family HTH domain